MIVSHRTRLLVFLFTLACGASSANAQPNDGLRGGPQLPSQQNQVLAQAEAKTFVEWATESPERLQATLKELGIDGDVAQMMEEAAQDEVPAFGMAGTYLIHKSITPFSSTTTVEISEDLSITRTVRDKSGRVISRRSGKATRVGSQLKVDFGGELTQAVGLGDRLGRIFKGAARAIRGSVPVSDSTQGVQYGLADATYTFDGQGGISGSFLGINERGTRADLVQPMEGSYKLWCADLKIEQRGRAGFLTVTRTPDDGEVLTGRGLVRGERMRVRFDDGSQGDYVFRADNKRVMGTFTPVNGTGWEAIDGQSTIDDGGWRQGVTPELDWLERSVAKMASVLGDLGSAAVRLARRIVDVAYRALRDSGLFASELTRAIVRDLRAGLAKVMATIEHGAGHMRVSVDPAH